MPYATYGTYSGSHGGGGGVDEYLAYALDQMRARLTVSQQGFVPTEYWEFGGGATLLDPRVTFSRSTPAWYFKNGVLRKAEIDEPVFEDGTLRLEAQATNTLVDNVGLVDGWSVFGGIYDQFTSDDKFPGVSVIELEATKEAAISSTRLQQTADKNVTGVRCHQVFVKQAPGNQGDTIELCPAVSYTDGTATTAPGVRYTWSTEDVTLYGGALNGGALDVGDGWVMLWLTFQAASPNISACYFRLYWEGLTGDFADNDIVYAALPCEFMSSSPLSPVLTNDSPVTRAADNFAIEGAVFQEAFNPTSGILVFKVGEGSAESKVTLGPLEFDDMQAGERVMLVWNGGDISVFKDGVLDYTLQEDLSPATSLEFESIRLSFIAMYSPTDA